MRVSTVLHVVVFHVSLPSCPPPPKKKNNKKNNFVCLLPRIPQKVKVNY